MMRPFLPEKSRPRCCNGWPPLHLPSWMRRSNQAAQIGDDLLKLRRGESRLPIVAAKEKQVIRFFCWCAHGIFLVAGLV